MANELHSTQHYVPVFLLREWENSSGDGKLICYKWANSKFLSNSLKAKSSAAMKHIYSVSRCSGGKDVQIERDFLGPEIDEPAASVHKKLISDRLKEMSPIEKEDWARFLVAQLLRTPDMIDKFRNGGRDVIGEHCRGRYEDHIDDDIGLILTMNYLASGKFNKMFSGSWSVKDVSDSKLSFLISDRPLVSQAGDGQVRYALPISPNKVFICSSSSRLDEYIDSLSSNNLVKMINRLQVKNACSYVYANNLMQEKFVEKNFKPAIKL